MSYIIPFNKKNSEFRKFILSDINEKYKEFYFMIYFQLLGKYQIIKSEKIMILMDMKYNFYLFF